MVTSGTGHVRCPSQVAGPYGHPDHHDGDAERIWNPGNSFKGSAENFFGKTRWLICLTDDPSVPSHRTAASGVFLSCPHRHPNRRSLLAVEHALGTQCLGRNENHAWAMARDLQPRPPVRRTEVTAGKHHSSKLGLRRSFRGGIAAN